MMIFTEPYLPVVSSSTVTSEEFIYLFIYLLLYGTSAEGLQNSRSSKTKMLHFKALECLSKQCNITDQGLTRHKAFVGTIHVTLLVIHEKVLLITIRKKLLYNQSDSSRQCHILVVWKIVIFQHFIQSFSTIVGVNSSMEISITVCSYTMKTHVRTAYENTVIQQILLMHVSNYNKRV